LAALAVTGIAATGVLVANSLTPLSPRLLTSTTGRPFSGEDFQKIDRAFREKHIDYRPVDRKIEVSAEQYAQANEIIAKLDVGPRSWSELRNPSNSWSSVFANSHEKEQQDLLAREKELETYLSNLPGVVWSVVSLRYPKPTGFQPRAKPSAFVFLEAEGDRLLPATTVSAIEACLIGYEPELTTNAITVIDRRGHPYLEAGKPGQGNLSRTKAREESLKEDILEKLHWVSGVEVWVSLSPAAPSVSVSEKKAMVDASAGANDKAVSIITDTDPKSPAFVPIFRINQPLSLPSDADAKVVATDPKTKPSPDSPARVEDIQQRPDSAPAEHVKESGRVVVRVPRSFILNAMIRPDDREPTKEELAAAEANVAKQIKSLIELVIPDLASWKVDIHRNPDEIDIGRRTKLASSSDQRRKALDWGLVGAGAAAVAILVALASWIQVARAPGRHTQVVQGTRRYHVDSPTAPAPSERVRELVRRNPETAASVLQRWTAQGGGI
jgi:type III secretory pathway lipoprotein EscJ